MNADRSMLLEPDLARVSLGEDPVTPGARWIWSDPDDPRPANRFTWFRRVVHLDDVPDRPRLLFAADSTAQLWVNGQVLRRKVARYDEPQVRAEVVDVGRHLHRGANVVVVLHHNWGDIVTFQRSANEHAGLWVDSSWLRTDPSWRWQTAEGFAITEQFRGAHDHTPRIRYPIDWDARQTPTGVHAIDFDDADWLAVAVVSSGPWPDLVPAVETPGQRETDHLPGGVVAAGSARHGRWSGEMTDRPSLLATAQLEPDHDLTAAAGALVDGRALSLQGRAGQTRYVTVDFHRPVHGYPFLEFELTHGTAEIRIGYGELVTSAYDGSTHLTESGWIDVDGVVATGYADRIVVGPGRRRYELPDERTARWVTVHVTFTDDTSLTLHRLGMVKSQYPIQPVGSFSCGDEQIEQIVKLCLVHAELTMSDTYVDTPGREDGQWIEDAHPRALVAQRWFDDTRLRRLMIRTLADGQDDQGELHPFFPSNFPARPAHYDWSVQWVAMLYDDYRWNADVAFVEEHFATLTRFWVAALAHLDDAGLWRTHRVFGDIRASRPPRAGGSSGPITPWVIDRLRWSAELARAVGAGDHAARWAAVADQMSSAFRDHHLVRDHPDVAVIVADRWEVGLPADQRGYSQAGQAVALLNGLLTPAEATTVIDYAFPAPDAGPPVGVARWNNPTWSYRVLRALSAHGQDERAVAHLKERFAPYLPGHPRNRTPLSLQGPYGGPLPEYWLSRDDLGIADGEINPAQPVDVTGSHGWGSVPLLWLHDSLLGVTVDEPGGAVIGIRPAAAGLPFVSGWTQTPRGPVHVHLDPRQPALRFVLPPDVTAVVAVPAELGTGWNVSGPGRPVSRDERSLTVDQPGSWTISP